MREGPAEMWASLLGRHAGGPWERVDGGESVAVVLRSPDGAWYAKCVDAHHRGELAAERDRVAWLQATGVPAPRVVAWDADDRRGACLITSAVAGVPAAQLDAPTLWHAWPGIAAAVRRLHALPAGACPFRRDLAQMAARARDVVARGAVNPAFLDDDDRARPPGELLARVTAQLDRRIAQELGDLVVCHGDLCLPNVLVDPRTLAVTGFVDLGRLGLADRHADIALLLANARETWSDEREAAEADAVFDDNYGGARDAARQRFYLQLDPLTWG